ncbi:MAG: hypothetical protein JNJ44_07085 [Zoogloeaceae bacterium]|nr:hypothetical protein [Zoogloeaceae bacterium]
MDGGPPTPPTRPPVWIGPLLIVTAVICATPALAESPPLPASELSDPRLPFAIGDRIEARVGDVWIPAQVRSFQQVRTARGFEIGYGVSLANGKKAILSAKQLRKPGGT